MRILFDQGAQVPIAAWIREHTVITTLEEQWDTLVNGELLRVAEEAGFDVKSRLWSSAETDGGWFSG
jgi:hypothetical protein